MQTEPSNNDWHLSPKYPSQKYWKEEVSAIEVFEDQVRGWVLDFAEQLASQEHSGIAVLMLATSYFEPIECFRSGQDTDTSGKLFKRSVRTVFREVNESPNPDKVAGILLNQLRNGLFHTGLVRPLLVLVREGEPIKVEMDGQTVRAIQINATAFLECVQRDFEDYVSELKHGSDHSTRDNFEKMWKKRGGLADSDESTGASGFPSGSTQTQTATSTSASIDPDRFTTRMSEQ